jgi:DNA-binding transcriptional LysR family regulator
MELRDLEYFAVAAEHRHLGRAAVALGLSQPALSKSLQRLERALHVKLVKRTPKGIELTQEGSTLLLRVGDLRLSLKEVAREVKEVSEGKVAQLRIGASVATSEGVLATAMARFLEESPRTMFNVVVSDNDLLIPALRNGELDAVVNFLPIAIDSAGLIRQPLYDDEDVVCASTSHRLAKSKSITIQNVAEERWAISEPKLVPAQRLFQAFRQAGLQPPRIAVQSRSPSLRLRLAASSGLLDLNFRSAFSRFKPEKSVTTLPIKDLTQPHPVGLLYRRDAYQSIAMRRFVESVQSAASNILD